MSVHVVNVVNLFHLLCQLYIIIFPGPTRRRRGPRDLPRRVRNRRRLLQGGAQAERTGITFQRPNHSTCTFLG